MKSYLSLIPISAKVHKRQNQMTVLCIVFAVFLVTSIGSLAEMGIRMEKGRLLNKHGDLSFEKLVSNLTVQTLFIISVILFFLVLIAGGLMISSSMNSNVIQRTNFFGMMRCIGMSRKQIIRFVRLEALNWCKTAIPVGVILGIVTSWGVSFALRFIVGEEFSNIPIFGISFIGIISGIVLGVITVLISSSAPAKRAAEISPITAVSDNLQQETIHHAATTRLFKIETALGINHATSGKKNLFLMTSSFALSIILFLSFSVFIDFIGYVMPQTSNFSDIKISSKDGSNTVDNQLVEKIKRIEGVTQVFGRRSTFEIPAKVNNDKVQSHTVDLISYDSFDLDALTKDKQLREGSDISKVYGDRSYTLATWDKESPLKIGDKIEIGSTELEIAGLLKYDPFSSDGKTNGKVTLIVSNETFVRLTGMDDYSLLMAQMTRESSDEQVTAIRRLVKDKYTFSDERDKRTTSTYLAFLVFVYGFLAIIMLVTILNIMNSISLSVSSRMKQYGAMRAVGMDNRQLTKMITAEAFTYAIFGGIIGCIIGLLFSKLLYDRLITAQFPYAEWGIPVVPLSIITLFVIIAVIFSVYLPSKRIYKLSITNTINEL